MVKFNSFVLSAAICAFMLCAASCDNSFIYDNEGDCSTKVQFVFKKHRQALKSVPGRETDVFYSTVGSVHLFVYDADSGNLVFEKTERTENLKSASELKLGSASEKNLMQLDLEPGKYRFVAWCGLDENDHNNAFSLNEIETRGGYKECGVKRHPATGHPLNQEKFESVYHGSVEVAEVTINDNGAKIIPIELTKDNNDIAVFVQHISHTFNDGDYEVVYVDANGTMKFDDNSLTSSNKLEYRPHTSHFLTSGTEYNDTPVETSALVAHISTSRLMEANQNDARIEVRSKEGKTIFSIPFIKYVLQMQTETSDGQYYLDCEDTYNCSFFLTGEDDKWMAARIIINNWVVVPDQNTNI